MQNLNNILGQYSDFLLVVAVLLIVVGNICFWLLSKAKRQDTMLSDILLRGQAELAGRLSQLSEHSSQEQNKIAAAINEQKLAMLKIMDEKLFKKMKSVGAANLVCGIIAIVAGVATGIVLIVNGARLLAHKSDRLF